MAVVSVPCGTCNKPLRRGDEFCEGCGTPVTAAQEKAIKDQLDILHADFIPHAARMRGARKTIGWLSFLFLLGAVVFFFITKSKVDATLAPLGAALDSEPLEQTVAGVTTVGELRNLLERQPWQ